MRRLLTVTLLPLVILAGLWLAAGWSTLQQGTFFGVRDGIIQLSGILALWLMTAGILLSLRPRWLESRTAGLDRTYRTHKWIGVDGFVLSVFHWFMATGFRWLIRWGVMQGQSRAGGQRGEHPGAGTAAASLFDRLKGLAHPVSEWAFYALIALIAISLLTLITYKLFSLSHRLMPFMYLALVFHSVLLFTVTYWLQPIGVASALMMIFGTVSAVMSIFRVPARARRVRGKVESVRTLPELKVMEMRIRLEPGWKGHAAGQFAFVKTSPWESPHPFTIASAWRGDGELTFLAKSGGDYTSRLPQKLRAGGKVRVEGPYGRFDFKDGKKRQIWIGAGVGITPFIARMKDLALHPESRKVDLYHATSQPSDVALGFLRADAAGADVGLRVWDGTRQGRLSASLIMENVPDWKEAGIWFCGPSRFARTLKRDFRRAGLPSDAFHRELYKMR